MSLPTSASRSGLPQLALLAHGYDTVLWWIAGIFAGGAVIGGALLRRGPLVQSAHRPRQTTG